MMKVDLEILRTSETECLRRSWLTCNFRPFFAVQGCYTTYSSNDAEVSQNLLNYKLLGLYVAFSFTYPSSSHQASQISGNWETDKTMLVIYKHFWNWLCQRLQNFLRGRHSVAAASKLRETPEKEFDFLNARL